MTLKKINQTTANMVFEFIRKHPDVPDTEIESAIRNHFPGSEDLDGAIKLYVTMKRGNQAALKLGAPKAVMDACWSTIESVRHHRNERARIAKKRTASEKNSSFQKNDPKNVAEWTKLLALASKDPKHWAKVFVHNDLPQDLFFALARKESVNPRENWFREKIDADPSLRKRVQAMMHEVTANQEILKEKARREMAQRFGDRERRVQTQIEYLREKGMVRPLNRIERPKHPNANILVNGDPYKKNIDSPKRGGGSGEASAPNRQYRIARPRRRR